MKAVVFHDYGDIDQLVYQEIADPVLESDEVLVKVEACALNHLDIWIRQGIPAYKIKLPHITGSDVSGSIAQVGSEVEGISEGMRVMISPGLSCFECDYCLSGRDNLCQTFAILGAGTDGGYAQYVKTRWVHVMPIPESVSYIEAAAFPLTFLTAWHMLISRAGLRPGQWVLVHGAGSGVGSAAIQIAKYSGAFVLATAGSDEKCEKAKALGADEVLNYNSGEFLGKIKSLTGGKGANIVFEHVGASTWPQSIQALAKGGSLVFCGATAGAEVNIDLRYLFSRELNVLGAMMGTRCELLDVMVLLEAGKIKPVIDHVFTLQEAPQAQRYMLERKNFGKIVLNVGQS